MAEVSEQVCLRLCARGRTLPRSLTDAQSNSGVTAELTPVSVMLLLKQTSQPELDLPRQAIPLSAPGTPHCLMPVRTAVPGLSAQTHISPLRLAHGFLIIPLSLPIKPLKHTICESARCLKPPCATA